MEKILKYDEIYFVACPFEVKWLWIYHNGKKTSGYGDENAFDPTKDHRIIIRKLSPDEAKHFGINHSYIGIDPHAKVGEIAVQAVIIPGDEVHFVTV